MPYEPYRLSLQAETTVYQREIRCLIQENDFNYSMNPTIMVNSSGSVRDFATGSSFRPYFTTIGLYNEADELLIVGKVSTPVMISAYSDMTVIVKYDF